jgi:hypothetical protein
MEGIVEQWRPVVGYEGLYEVSDRGRVKSLHQYLWSGSHWYKVPHRQLKPSIARTGYPVVRLTKDGKGRTITIHTLVLTAFVGAKPFGQECRHLNGNPQDCSLSNLQWGTPVENSNDKIRHGTVPKGSQHHNAKLTAEQVYEIRSAAGTHKEIAAKYEVTKSVVTNIKNRKSWAWLQ